ncbi:MAG TPA: hypothetical protein VNK49_08025 [Anaerolineales bacterium]|nr:hypothetical protein [Anaerolineales bacterium]
MFIPPSRLTFWRFVLSLSAGLPFLSVWQLLGLANRLGIDVPSRPSWIGFLAGLSLMGLIPLLLLPVTGSRYRERLLTLLEFPERAPRPIRLLSVPILILALIGYTLVFMHPFIREIFGGEGWFRFLIFWLFNLIGLCALKSIHRPINWFIAFLAVALGQGIFHLFMVNLSGITDYPFARGWSETSRYYYPSLFLSEKIYGQSFPLPILHPTLHLLLVPPYLFNAPLWAHRFWQAAIRLVLVGAIVPLMLKRLSIEERGTRWLVALWMFLYLFMGPLYFHLAVPVILMLLGFSSQNERRTWIVLIVASLWCGWSRVNWYPVPGMIAAVLYLLETPYMGKGFWRYLLKPALWFLTGTLIAFASQRFYILISGVPDSAFFYTSFSSDLLWYRLLPNASFFLGILPGAVLASFPIWIVMYRTLRADRIGWHPLRLIFLLAALLVLFLGGLVVSLKIGGGADLHNLDAYFVLLLIVSAYLVFARYRREEGNLPAPTALPWAFVILLIAMPLWSQMRFNAGFVTYDETRTQKVLTELQKRVDQVSAQGGEILFITQRHLISMGMLQNVTLVPEYEREDLMEMAMGNNTKYLTQFRKDMEAQRFALIVVDPLNFNIMTSRRSFAEENNVWVRRVMKHILCNYRLDTLFPEDEIALYVPQQGERQCP